MTRTVSRSSMRSPPIGGSRLQHSLMPAGCRRLLIACPTADSAGIVVHVHADVRARAVGRGLEQPHRQRQLSAHTNRMASPARVRWGRPGYSPMSVPR